MVRSPSATRWRARTAVIAARWTRCATGTGTTPAKYRPHAQVDIYESTLRPFIMYRDTERLEDWPDADEKLGDWKPQFTTATPNPGGTLEREADFSRPRTIGRATKARNRDNS